jgi:GntR family transcriptional repressor for pyruvate dehydrogenase complex
MSSYDPIRKSGVAEEISVRLLTMIKDKHLRPGEKLPAERELAAMLHVSRPSLREALRALAIMNIIEIRQGDGTYVTSLEPDLLVEHLDFVISLDDATILQLFEARKIVEVGAASLAAKYITDEQASALENCLEKSNESINDPQAFLEVDLELHKRITEAAGNPFIKRFLTSLNRIGLASRSRTVEIPGVKEKTVQDHREIVAAITNGDEDAAADAMLSHLNNVEKRLLDLIDEQSVTKS